MKELRYFLTKIIYKIRGNKKEVISNYFRQNGMQIGKNANICSNIMTPEVGLIELGDNVTIAGSVHFITHDNSISKICKNSTDLFGRIKIGNNCFIGEGATILYGVTLADNIVVAAGSVVTRSFHESNIIIGGNPAKVITTWKRFEDKSRSYIWNLDIENKNDIYKFEYSNRLIER